MRISNIIDYTKYSFNADDEWGDYYNGEYRKPWFNKNGYSQKNYVCTDGKCRTTGEHCAKWVYFNGEIPEGMQIDHIIPIRNGGTNKLSNLRLVTPKENSNNPISRENQSSAKIKLWQTEEYKTKMNEVKQSEEFKEKQKIAHIGKKWKLTEKREQMCKKIYQYKGNELIAIYKSRNEVERLTEFNRERITYHCNDGKEYKGYRWSYEPL